MAVNEINEINEETVQVTHENEGKCDVVEQMLTPQLSL